MTKIDRKRWPVLPQAMNLLALLLLLAVVISSGAAKAAPTGNGAHKVSLTRTNRDCFGVIVPPALTAPFGFAIINKTGAGNLIANVVVQGATPNTTYNVRVIQTFPTPSATDCATIDGTLTTDADGNGATNIHEAVLPGATDAFVVLNNQADPSGDFFTTEDVLF